MQGLCKIPSTHLSYYMYIQSLCNDTADDTIIGNTGCALDSANIISETDSPSLFISLPSILVQLLKRNVQTCPYATCTLAYVPLLLYHIDVLPQAHSRNVNQ